MNVGQRVRHRSGQGPGAGRTGTLTALRGQGQAAVQFDGDTLHTVELLDWLVPVDESPPTEADQPSWATYKGHGRPTYGWYYGTHRRKPATEPRRVQFTTSLDGMLELTDTKTSNRVTEMGYASRFWLAPAEEETNR